MSCSRRKNCGPRSFQRMKVPRSFWETNGIIGSLSAGLLWPLGAMGKLRDSGTKRGGDCEWKAQHGLKAFSPHCSRPLYSHWRRLGPAELWLCPQASRQRPVGSWNAHRPLKAAVSALGWNQYGVAHRHSIQRSKALLLLCPFKKREALCERAGRRATQSRPATSSDLWAELIFHNRKC